MGGILGRDALESLGDGVLEFFCAAGLGGAEECLYLAPHHFDGIEIGRVGREEPHAGAGCSDEGDGLLVFVGRKVIHDHDVARPQARAEYFSHVSVEDRCVRRSFDGHARGAAVEPYGTEHRGGAPVSVRCLRQQASAPGRTAPEAGQVGLRRRFVEEDEPGRLESALAAPPAPAGADDVRPVLLRGPKRLFLKVRPMSART